MSVSLLIFFRIRSFLITEDLHAKDIKKFFKAPCLGSCDIRTGEKLYGLLLKISSQIFVVVPGLGMYVGVKLDVAILRATSVQHLIELDSVGF